MFGWLAFWLGQGWFGSFLIGIGQYLSGLFESDSISRSGRVVGALFGSEALVSWSRGLYFLIFFVNELNSLLWLDVSTLCCFFWFRPKLLWGQAPQMSHMGQVAQGVWCLF